MQAPSAPPIFEPDTIDAAGVLTWIHIGDLHLVEQGVENHTDLRTIVRVLNNAFAHKANFVYLPGDNADNGSTVAYSAVRDALDQLTLPWCAIVGDHDVHEKSHANFLAAMSRDLHYAFTLGDVRFLALNAFDIPEPPSFSVLEPQLGWLEDELAQAKASEQRTVLLLHCYPGDLKQGREAVQSLVAHYRPLIIDMGHTHYNEVSNDGHTLYTATRSTGQIEEGPVGFSVTSIDGDVVSWRFFNLADLQAGLPAVLVTAPADARFATSQTQATPTRIRAQVWSSNPVTSVTATLDSGRQLSLEPIANTSTWQTITPVDLSATNSVAVIAVTANTSATDTIQLNQTTAQTFTEGNHEDRFALEAWPEHGLLGSQLGPNKNGKKW